MRRAILASLLAGSMLLAAAPAFAQAPSSVISGIGLVDYRFQPRFKQGDWVRYRIQGTSTEGVSENYVITLVICGDETLWGERCFWIETWTEAAGGFPNATAALISYAIFGDSLAIPRVQKYTRKVIYESTDKGEPMARVVRQPLAAFKQREEKAKGVTIVTDTVGTDTVSTPQGAFRARLVEIKSGAGLESSGGDSTVYSEMRETRTRKVAFEVPISHIASEFIDRTVKRRAWMAGRSQQGAPERIQEKSLTTARLIGFGSGLASRLLPHAVTPGGIPIGTQPNSARPDLQQRPRPKRGG